MKKISIVTACYNEEENVALLIQKVQEIMDEFSQYNYEHIFIDNASEDNTVAILKKVSEKYSHMRKKILTNYFNYL